MTNTTLDIVTPVYNEGENILDMLRAFEQHVKTPIRVLICYDFDEDDTLAAIRNVQCSFEVIPVKNRGKGVHGAIMTGFEEARAPAVLVFPADEAYNAPVIDPMVAAFDAGNDMVVASRFMQGGGMHGGPVVKSWIVRAGSFLLRWMARLPVRDATYGLRLQSKRVLNAIQIESTEGWTYAIELLVKCHRLGWKIAEVPAQWHQREKGASRFRLRRWLPLYGRWFFYAFATTCLRKGPETVTRKFNAHIMTETNSSRIVDACQICGNSSLDPIMFLGYLPPVNDFHPIGQRPKEESRYPAEIIFCPRCHLLQSGYIVDPKIIFPASYPYTSSTTKVLRENFADLSREVSEMFPLKPEDLVIDIGSNDGNLLSNFQSHARVLGITPEDIGTIAIERGIPTILDYFTGDVVRKVKQEHGQAKIITATNAFAHIDNINDIVESVLDLLTPDGVFIIEVHYLVPVVRMNQFDTIYHEHLRHYSLHSLQYLLAAHGLEVIHAKLIPSHAGSIRVYAARTGVHPRKDTVAPLLAEEEHTVLNKEQLIEFQKNALGAKIELCALLSEIKKHGERIYGIGAPSRGTTLIHYVGIDEGIVDCILEIQGSHKIGKYVPGTLIPVLEESKLYEDQPEYALLFSWQITDELIPKIRAKGFKGKFIVPLPHAHVL